VCIIVRPRRGTFGLSLLNEHGMWAFKKRLQQLQDSGIDLKLERRRLFWPKLVDDISGKERLLQSYTLLFLLPI